MNKYRDLKHLAILAISLIMLVSTGCDDDEVAPSYTINDFVGSWTATTFVHTSNSEPEQSIDLTEIGGEVRFTVLAGGKIRTWVEIGTYSDEWDALVTLSDDEMTTTPSESTRPGTIHTFDYDGTTLKLTNLDDTFDFTLMGAPGVSTTSVGNFERQ